MTVGVVISTAVLAIAMTAYTGSLSACFITASLALLVDYWVAVLGARKP